MRNVYIEDSVVHEWRGVALPNADVDPQSIGDVWRVEDARQVIWFDLRLSAALLRDQRALYLSLRAKALQVYHRLCDSSTRIGSAGFGMSAKDRILLSPDVTSFRLTLRHGNTLHVTRDVLE